MAFFSSKDLPNVRPVADFNFAATKVLDNRINFSRGSGATYTDEMGIVRYVPHNVPRFDHDPTTGESLGLLIEESRTNVLGLSSDLTDNNGNDWDNINGTIATNQTTAPDGTTTAASFTASAGNAEHSVVFAELVPTGNVTVSVWVKTNTYSIVSFVLYGEANSTVSYNINTKTVYNQGSNVSRAKIIEYPNGWYRIVATMNCTVANSRTFRLFASTGNFDAGGSESFYYWGPQLESGSFETSYIPTYVSNTSVTRNEDRAVVKGEKFKKIFDTGFNSFSALVDYDNTDTVASGTSNGVFHLWGEASGYDDRITVSSDNDTVNTAVRTRAFGGGSGIFANNDALSASSQAATQKFAFSWSVPDYSNTSSRRWAFSFSGEDVDVVSNTSGTSVPQVTRLGLGINPTRLDEHGGKTHYKRVVIYNKVLSDEELKGLSAI
jgi:hypothetical protein